jgi:PIN domain nuclease of toxin-antitoxin system
MRLLLDTHTFLWFVENSPSLSTNALTYIKDVSNEVYVSIASIWELAIKISVGKLQIAQPLEVFVPSQLSLNKMSALQITLDAAALVATLPLHHRDPFDRLLIAQALTTQMPIVSKDEALDAYGITRLW